MSSLTIPFVRAGSTIPRMLHQIYFQPDGRAALPDALAANVELLRRQNPDWTHRLYGLADMESFIAEHYGAGMLRRFRRIAPEYGAARADLFRYLALYRIGGVYLDVKSRFAGPIDSVLREDDRYLLSQWRNGPGQPHEGWGLHAELAGVPGGEFQQWHIVCAPGHPFLRAVIEKVVAAIDGYRPWRSGVGWLGVLRTTGPIAYTSAIAPLIHDAPCRIVADETELGLEYSVLQHSAHQGLFARHYTQATTPVIRRPRPGSWVDAAWLTARSLRGRARRGVSHLRPA